MASRTPFRAALLSALLSWIVMLIQLEYTTSFRTSLPTPTELALLARGHLGRTGENSTDEGGLLRSVGVDSTVTDYLETSDSGPKPNTEMPFLSSTKASAQNHTEVDVDIKKDSCSNKEGLCATVTVGSTLTVTNTSAGETLPPTTDTSITDLVTVPSPPVQYTDMEGVRHISLEATHPRPRDRSLPVLEEVVTQPEMLRSSWNDGTASPEPEGFSNSEILAITMGSFVLALLVCSLAYQHAVFIRRKRMLKRSCSVYVIQNHMHKNDLEANNSEPETRF